MMTYLIDPKAPLLFRDGRPFGAAERAETLPFPLPSTIVGAMRAAYGDAKQLDFASQKDQVLKFHLTGPLLAQRHLLSGEVNALFPKPADAVCFKQNETDVYMRLAPAAVHPGEGTDLPTGLLPLELSAKTDGKPINGAAFWRQDAFVRWLLDDGSEPKAVGVAALPVEIRSHVALSSETLTSRDGQLFQTAGLDFGPRRLGDAAKGWEEQSYALLVRVAVDGTDTAGVPDGLHSVGGERRLAWVSRCASEHDPWPVFPECLRLAFAKHLAAGAMGLRLILLTPALFKHGWRPDWLDENLIGTPPRCAGLKLQLRAVALQGWQAFSGWDMRPADGRVGGGARAVRRMVPAGTTYWFDLLPNTEISHEEQLQALANLWLLSLCDQEHDRRDGFGVAVPGVWNTSAP